MLAFAMDDTIARKTGKKIHGSAWKRDPLGPAFQTNLVLAQRYLQFSAASSPATAAIPTRPSCAANPKAAPVALQALAGGASFQGLHPPKWRKDRTLDGKLPSTGDLLRLLRYETWAGVLRPGTFHHFVTDTPPDTNSPKPRPDLPAIHFAAA